ncbi:helix-turn-helix domain-containing protein [Solwaraspora sp. WMMB335]|uniref:helix-turn-helix domain-containing protein n=1 Tax=Solwaraspora sp. WMMB335 TaxID=3404118 RepID=UPI003B953BB8
MPVPPLISTPWRRLPAELAPAMRSRLPAVVRAVATTVTRTTPAFAAAEHDAKLQRDVRTAVEVALERFLDLVGTDEPALPPPVREVFVFLGAAEARENRGPETLLAALRTAARLLLRQVGESLAALGPVDADLLIDCADAVSAFVDELVAASTDGFAEQVREQAGEGERLRRHLAELLLGGSAPAGAVASAATRAGWPDLDVVVPVVLPAEQARDVRFRFGGDAIVAERGRDAVVLLRAGVRTGRAALADALRGRGAVVGPALPWPQLPPAVRLAELASGVPGVPAAAAVPAVPAVAASAPEAVFAEDHLVHLALQGAPDALAVLAARRLAPLHRMRPAQRESLLATLQSWLRHWGSRTAVSAELFVHPQTVSYRLRRLRELLGDDLDDPDRRFELALVLAARLGG